MKRPIIYKNKPVLNADVEYIDIFHECIKELILIYNPTRKKSISSREVDEFIYTQKISGVWIFFYWLNKVYFLPNEKYYIQLFTSRNRNLIKTNEQLRLYNSKIGIAGLSVGSRIFDGLLRSGIGNRFFVADFDKIEVTNLNRINASLIDYGLPKGEVMLRKAWEINPFIDIELYGQGLQIGNTKKFLLEDKINILVDAVDDIYLKIKLRKYCKENKIPVVMATDFGDEVVISIERYDLYENLELFHGALIGEKVLDQNHNLKKQDWIRIANKIIGFKPGYRLESSLLKVGDTLGSVPQLGITSMVAGAVASDVIRRIILGNKINGNYLVKYQTYLE